MLYFENVRRSLNKNQQEMAQACGIGRSTWQLIEYGALLPSRTVADIIRELTGVVVPCEDQCLKAAERRKWRRQRPYEFGAADADMWTRVHRHCESMTCLYENIGPAQVAWMEQLLQIGSVTEGFHLLQLAHQGGKPFLDSPHELGYRTQPLVDAQGLVLGERRLPGLRGLLGDVRYLLWPQISIRPRLATFRVDALMLLSWKGRSLWCSKEVDGPLHDAEQDRKRRETLKLPEIRLTVAEVDRFQSVSRMSEEALKLFAA